MQNPFNQTKQPNSTIQWILIISICGIIGFNSIKLFKETSKAYKLKKKIGHHFDGYKFLGLKEALKDVDYIGYYTDKDLTATEPGRQFAQAQYILAPVILDLNNTDHQYILFDCSSLKTALLIMNQIKATPIKKNQFGLILAKKSL